MTQPLNVGLASEARSTTGRRAKEEARTPNAERRTPNAKRRTPNAKRQTPLARFPPLPLVTEPLSITLLATMGGYKGRVNVKHRKRRSAKAERIKAVAATKTAAKKSD